LFIVCGGGLASGSRVVVSWSFLVETPTWERRFDYVDLVPLPLSPLHVHGSLAGVMEVFQAVGRW